MLSKSSIRFLYLVHGFFRGYVSTHLQYKNKNYEDIVSQTVAY